ncbi:unnamed protein product, partial [marine sediment metagenome]
MLLIGISLVVFIVIYQLIGIFLVVLGVIYQFPSILMFNSIPSIIFALGLILTILSILMLIEVLEKVKTTKSYT